MKELFGWVPWFNSLAKKVADGGLEYLEERAREVDWGGKSPVGEAHGHDPLFFITFVAQEGHATKAGTRERVFASVSKVFEIPPLQTAGSPEVWNVPRPHSLFQCQAPDDPANRDAVWRLLRAAVAGSVDAETFEAVGRLGNISWSKLTAVLFLIDAASHLRLSKPPPPKGPAQAYGVKDVTSEPPRWAEYQARIQDARANFPGCELYEIEMFARLQSARREGGRNLQIRPDRCWVTTTNASWGEQVGDHWAEFDENNWVRVEDSTSYRVDEPRPGDLMLARYGKSGRGIGVVYRNDYGPDPAPEGRIHVLWLNKSSCDLRIPAPPRAFDRASKKVEAAFHRAAEYEETWKLLGKPVRRYWLMSPGTDADLWKRFRRDRVATIGFEEYPVGDLSRLTSKEQVGRAMKTGAGENPVHHRLALWEFSHVMKPGDVIFAKRGRSEFIGHGIVRSDYRHEPTRDGHHHVRTVEWKSNFSAGITVREKLLVGKTLTDITKYPDQVRAFKEAIRSKLPTVSHALNQILYGPPGTGKTYATVGRALAIIDGREVGVDITAEEKLEFRKRRFESGKGGGTVDGQIAMVTFHQNYAYEDFVEGIRPRLGGSGDARVAKAAGAATDAGTGSDAGVPKVGGAARPDDSASEVSAAGVDDQASVGDTASGRDAAAEAVQPRASQAGGRLNYELTPGIFRRICAAADAERERAEEEDREPDRFVLIIDEINRGNIPKIFGELITLIEPSRRLGRSDETTVTLPYSGDDFGVPENLHVIGTMNTADRSIQQLDTALRRRFTFVEMMPEPNHELIPADVEGVDCRRMLQAMNERIALLLDREHQIGHTYLLKVKSIDDLADRFRNRIFPLLQEYFYDDWRKIRAVLGGNAFVEQRKVGEGYAKGLNQEFDLVDDETVVYERLPKGNAAWNATAEYQMIYQPTSG